MLIIFFHCDFVSWFPHCWEKLLTSRQRGWIGSWLPRMQSIVTWFQGSDTIRNGYCMTKLLSSWHLESRAGEQHLRGRGEGPHTDSKITPPQPTLTHSEVHFTNPPRGYQANQMKSPPEPTQWLNTWKNNLKEVFGFTVSEALASGQLYVLLLNL